MEIHHSDADIDHGIEHDDPSLLKVLQEISSTRHYEVGRGDVGVDDKADSPLPSELGNCFLNNNDSSLQATLAPGQTEFEGFVVEG